MTPAFTKRTIKSLSLQTCILSLTVFGLGCASAAPVAPPPPPVVVETPNAPTNSARADENDPLTYVEKLQDPREAPKAVLRLEQFFEDTMAKDNQDPRGPNVKPLLDKIIEPLTQSCVEGKWGKGERLRVIKIVADARDVRGAACLVDALEEYEPDVTEEELRLAAKGVVAMKWTAANTPLFKAFAKFEVSRPKAATIYRDLNEAMEAASDPSWETPCIAMLAAPVAPRKEMQKYLDDSYHQLTCAQILGTLRSEKAIQHLIKVMLSPKRVVVQTTALNALIKIGKPAVSRAVSILEGKEKEFVEYAKNEYISSHTDENGHIPPAEMQLAQNAYLFPTAVILGSIGRDEAIEPMTKAIAKANAVDQAIIAREMLKLPITPASLQTVKSVYENTPLITSIPPGMNARQMLIEQLTYSFDSQLIPWLVKDTLAQRGDANDLEELRGDAYLLALKLATVDQLKDVDKLGNLSTPGGSKIQKQYAKEYNAAKEVLTECRNNVDCYLVKVVDPIASADGRKLVGVKCAHMIGVFGSPEIRSKIVDILPTVQEDSVRFGLLQAIDHFSPKGDPIIGGQLLKLLADAEASNDTVRRAQFSYFRQFGFRLQARAQ